VVLPETTAQVSEVLAWCQANGVKWCRAGPAPRSPAARLPLADGVVVGLSKFNRVLEVDYANRCAVVQPG
jgi:glycolate oxidase